MDRAKMSTNSVMPDAQVVQDISPRLKRKLDKVLRLKEEKASRVKLKTGPKPKHVQTLSRNKSSKVIEQYNAIAGLADIYAQAWANKQLVLCVQMQEQARDRAFGRPFVAINPEERPQNQINQDNRLQVAIQNLILPANQKRKASKALKSQTLTLEAGSTDANPIQAPAKDVGGQ